MAKEKENKTLTKYKNILKAGYISEQELISLRSWMARKATQDERREIFDAIYNKEKYISLDRNQVKKGLDFLKNQYKTPTGKLRTNNPFGTREIFVLENADDIVLKDLYDAGNMFSTFYLPVYQVQSKGGDSFDYYYNGKVQIIG